MEFTAFTRRPKVDVAIRSAIVLALVVLIIAAAIDRDAGQAVAAVVMGAWIVTMAVDLAKPVERVVSVVILVGFAAWLALTFF